MNQKELRRIAARQAMAGRYTQSSPPDAFREFSASQLYCAKCRQAMPVRQKLLLALPQGDLYDYICTGCGSSLGTRTGN
ncbi:MAG TPA: cytoplasmic protein [Oligoflexia bacterium]|nr:cytoplasmic protein [Oligoflexia bacterium]